MALFQQSVLRKHIETLNNAVISQKWEKFQAHFLNPTIQQNIRKSKEEQYQEGFFRDLFVTIFGYTLNPTENFNLTTEQKNITNSKKVDGAILIKGSDGLQNVVGVIELKGTDTTDLAKIEAQAFGYKTNQPGCNYVITSNFEKLRFYIDNTTQYQEFNLFTLTKDEFTVLYCCLDWESISNNLPTNLLNQSVSKENAITKQLYNDYSAFKRGLYNNLVELNPQHDKLLLFKKTQKLLDRFLFIFFAEDRLLLPTNLIRRINKEWENLQKMRISVSLYDRYVTYFHDLNEGAKVTLPAFGKKTGEAIEETHEIFAYNGGLFKNDEFLDNLKINDQLLYEHTHKMSDYDFQSEVDVNILGHIFENSLNEIDEIKSEIEGNVVDKTKTKRKKDGVFYTPKYITKYIVDNTVGKLCTEKKEELQLIEEEYHTEKNLQTKTKKALLDKLTNYREWLLQLTICDPACGSGAFLNQALEFLIEEHTYIDELQAKLMGDSLVLSDVENSILENNLYGVDLNDESIEIAKLSLWLRTAQKGRKLNSLNNNIKCGNSLIDDPEVAGDKAFSWEKEFPEVFVRGGFDVIIGNPPYVRVQSLKEHYFEQTIYYEKEFLSATSKYDLYVLFMEKSYKLINQKGIISFILPHKFIVADFGSGIRTFLTKHHAVESLIHFGSKIVFGDAATYTCIINLKKQNPLLKFIQIDPIELQKPFEFDEIKYSELGTNSWQIKDSKTLSILKKISKNKKLKDLCEGIYQGLITTGDDIFMMEGEIIDGIFYGFSNELNKKVEIEATILKEVLKGQDIKRYLPLKSRMYVIYPHKLDEKGKTVIIEENLLKIEYPLAYQYLENFKDQLIEKKIKYKMNPKYWYSLHRSRDISIFEKNYIITPQLQNVPSFTIKETDVYADAGGYLLIPKDEINFKGLLAVLNSKLLWFFIKNTSSEYGGGYFYFKTKYLEPFGVPHSKLAKIDFNNQVDKRLLDSKKYYKSIQDFINYYRNSLSLNLLTKKLQNWNELTFVEFINELNVAIKTAKGTPLTKKDEFEWIDLFEDNKKKALALKAEIDQTDKEIDQMVYELYGLTEEEIKIICDATS
jgi:type I restriction-modification system DNA methylase subunit